MRHFFAIVGMIAILLTSGCDHRTEKSSSKVLIPNTLTAPTNEDRAITRTRKIKEKISPILLSSKFFKVLSDGLTLNDFFDKVLAELPEDLRLIAEAETTAVGLKINLILDEHASIEGQSESSKNRQGEISTLVKKANPALTFVEGMQFTGQRMTTNDLLEDFQRISRFRGESEELIKKGSKMFLSRKLTKFWHQELINTPIKLFAVDQQHLAQLILILDIIERSELAKAPDLDVGFLNFGIRERVIIAHVVKIMKQENQKEGVLVIGAYHKHYLPDLCRQWGVKCEIIGDLPDSTMR